MQNTDAATFNIVEMTTPKMDPKLNFIKGDGWENDETASIGRDSPGMARFWSEMNLTPAGAWSGEGGKINYCKGQVPVEGMRASVRHSIAQILNLSSGRKFIRSINNTRLKY